MRQHQPVDLELRPRQAPRPNSHAVRGEDAFRAQQRQLDGAGSGASPHSSGVQRAARGAHVRDGLVPLRHAVHADLGPNSRSPVLRRHRAVLACRCAPAGPARLPPDGKDDLAERACDERLAGARALDRDGPAHRVARNRMIASVAVRARGAHPRHVQRDEHRHWQRAHSSVRADFGLLLSRVDCGRDERNLVCHIVGKHGAAGAQ